MGWLLKSVEIVLCYLLVAPVLAWICEHFPATPQWDNVTVFSRCGNWIVGVLIVAALIWQVARLVRKMSHKPRWHISRLGLVMMISGLAFDYEYLYLMGGWWDELFSESCSLARGGFWALFMVPILQAPHGFLRTTYRRWFMRRWPKRSMACWMSYFMLVSAALMVLVVGRTELRVIRDVRYTYFNTPEAQFEYAKTIIDANRYGEDFEDRGCCRFNYLVGPFHSDSAILRTHAAFNARVAQRRGCQVPKFYRMNESERRVQWDTDCWKHRQWGKDIPSYELKSLEDCSLEAGAQSANEGIWPYFLMTALKNEVLVYGIYTTRYR